MTDQTNDTLFDEIDDLLAGFDGKAIEGGADPGTEDDNCVGGACKI